MTVDQTLRKLDSDFFAGRWNRVTDRRRELHHVNQILAKLAAGGLVYKSRHGRYSFAVPLLGNFIRRQQVDGPA